MKYRSRADIVSNILRTALNGTTKTRIMYGAYISYSQLTEYLAFLLEKGLLQHDESTQRYTLTQKGLNFVHSYDEISESLSPEVKNISSRTPNTFPPMLNR